jgi:TonB family protein
MTKTTVLVTVLLSGCTSAPTSTDPGKYAARANRTVLAATVFKGPQNEEERKLYDLRDQALSHLPGFRSYKENIGKEVQHPKIVHAEAPTYPFGARLQASQQETTILLAALVDKDGSVSAVKLIDGSDELMVIAAMNALRKWKFTPGTVEGKPQSIAMLIPIVFSLNQ